MNNENIYDDEKSNEEVNSNALSNDLAKDEDIEIVIDESELLEEYKDKWSYTIQKRGEDYYYSNNVLKVCKTKNKYIAKVAGSSNVPYEVTFEVTPNDIDFSCSCPCSFPCKHEYAVLMAISEGSYENVELKQSIKEKDSNIMELIKEIPAEELKEYLLSPIGKDKVVFENNTFNKYFRKYLPAQTYEFYYNNLYNSLVLNDNYEYKIKTYLDRVKQYISGNDFKEVIKIIRAIIQAYKDTNNINFDEYFTDILPSIGMYLRVSYRKGDDIVKGEVNSWIEELKKDNYYNNYYLEDIILSLK